MLRCLDQFFFLAPVQHVFRALQDFMPKARLIGKLGPVNGVLEVFVQCSSCVCAVQHLLHCIYEATEHIIEDVAGWKLGMCTCFLAVAAPLT